RLTDRPRYCKKNPAMGDACGAPASEVPASTSSTREQGFPAFTWRRFALVRSTADRTHPNPDRDTPRLARRINVWARTHGFGCKHGQRTGLAGWVDFKFSSPAHRSARTKKSRAPMAS